MKTIPNFFLPALCLIALISFLPPMVSAQTGMPVREFTNPDELVTLGRETSFSQSFQILGSFSRRFSDKVLIDRSGKTGAIGFNIPATHWRQALDFIANAHQLRIQEFPEFIEITAAPTQTSDRPASGTGTSTPVVTVAPLATLDSREIEISAIFFEGNRRVLRELGINWSAMKDGIVQVSSLAASSVSLEALQVNVPTQNLQGGWEVGALLNALESTNIGEILSSPKVRVMDGQEGNIQVGQDFSIKQRDFAGNVTDAFYSTGTILRVTPRVIHDQDTSFVLLSIRAERSTATPDPVSTIINKQEALTQVLLYTGESTVIAGLYETDEQIIRRGIPFLKDLPPWFFGLRYIFGYNSREFNQKELIIIIKAELVPSLRERYNLARPTQAETLNDGRQRIRENDPLNRN